jgi:hypothetical protein
MKHLYTKSTALITKEFFPKLSQNPNVPPEDRQRKDKRIVNETMES